MTQLADEGVQWEVSVDLVDVNEHQPRDVFAEDKLQELTASIASVGVLQAIAVRPKEDGRYELVAGERRLRAARAAGLATIPATVRDVPDDRMRLLAVVENLHRENLNPMELAAAYADLVEEHQLTQEDLATLLHVDRTHVSRTLALRRLPESVQRRVAAGVLLPSHADALVALHDPVVIELLAKRIVAEGLSVAAVRELIALGGLPGVETVDGRAERRRMAARPPVPADLAEVADSLGDLLDTRVRVLAGRKRGRIVVDFSDRADLDRILARLTTPVGV